MKKNAWKKTFVEKEVTYVLDMDGEILIIEDVPARVCVETGERLFTPATVERLQQTLWHEKQPSRIAETPVYVFAG